MSCEADVGLFLIDTFLDKVSWSTTEQDKMRSRLGAQRMPFSSAHNEESIFKCHILTFRHNSRQNGVVFHDCNKNACFTKIERESASILAEFSN